MSLPRYAARTAGFALLYLVATIGGQFTAVRDGGTALFWPAAAVGAVWLVAQGPYDRRRFDVIALGTIAASVLVTDHGFLAALALALPQIATPLLFAVLLDRWVPGWWLRHGDRFRRPGPTMTRIAGAAVAAALAGVVLQAVAAATTFGPVDAVWTFLRDAATILLATLAVRALKPGQRSGTVLKSMSADR